MYICIYRYRYRYRYIDRLPVPFISADQHSFKTKITWSIMIKIWLFLYKDFITYSLQMPPLPQKNKKNNNNALWNCPGFYPTWPKTVLWNYWNAKVSPNNILVVNQYAVRAVATIVSKGVARSAAPTDIAPHGKYFTRKDTFDISRFLMPIALKKKLRLSSSTTFSVSRDIARTQPRLPRTWPLGDSKVILLLLPRVFWFRVWGLGAGAGAGAGKSGIIRSEHMPCLHELRLREVNAFSQ